jgi:hypothetical protein
MQATAIVREAWELYKAHWKAFVPLALVVFVIIGLVSLLLTWALGLVGALIGGLLAIVGFFWLQGALVEAVRDVRDGKRDLSIGETFARVRPRLPAIIPAGLLAGLGIILGLILLIVPGLFLLTIWSMIIPVIVLEGRSAGESFGRSRPVDRREHRGGDPDVLAPRGGPQLRAERDLEHRRRAVHGRRADADLLRARPADDDDGAVVRDAGAARSSARLGFQA